MSNSLATHTGNEHTTVIAPARTRAAQADYVMRFLEALMSGSSTELEQTAIEELPPPYRLSLMKRFRHQLAEAQRYMNACRGTHIYDGLLESSPLKSIQSQLALVFEVHHASAPVECDDVQVDDLQADDLQAAESSREVVQTGGAEGALSATASLSTNIPADIGIEAAVEQTKDLWIEHPAQTLILSELAQAYSLSTPQRPRNLVVLGASTVGKTETILLHCATHGPGPELWATVQDPDFGEIRVKQQRIVFAECPPNGLAHSLFRELLLKMGHPSPGKVKEAMLKSMLCLYADRCGVRQIIVDDINHSVQVGEGEDYTSLRSKSAIYNFAKALRALAAEITERRLGVSIVLVGVDHAKHLGLNNSQYANRFNHVEHFNLYRLEKGRPVDAAIFKHRVESVLSSSVLPWDNEQPISDLWLRLHWATHGSIGNLANLARAAILYALACEAKKLTLSDFSHAYVNMPIEAVSFQSGTREPRRADPFRVRFKFPENTTYAKVKSVTDLIVVGAK